MVEFVFHRHGAPVARFNKSWATACKLAGCPGRLFHDLRRSAVRSMVQAGVNPQVAKKISGHKTDSMFQRYSILTTDDLRAALEKTEQYRAAEAAKQPRVVSMGR
jgi:integrase